MSTEASRPIRDGDDWEKGDRRVKPRNRRPRLHVDRRQNNKMLRQCPSGIVQRPPHHAIAVPPAMQNSYKDSVRSSAVGKQLKQKKSNSQAQHHLPAHLPPLDLAWTLYDNPPASKLFFI